MSDHQAKFYRDQAALLRNGFPGRAVPQQIETLAQQYDQVADGLETNAEPCPPTERTDTMKKQQHPQAIYHRQKSALLVAPYKGRAIPEAIAEMAWNHDQAADAIESDDDCEPETERNS